MNERSAGHGVERGASAAAFAEARALMPGGVNSPARACRSVGADPVFMASAEGPHLTDVDGHRYIDLVGAFGPMIAGHGHPEVLEEGHGL